MKHFTRLLLILMMLLTGCNMQATGSQSATQGSSSGPKAWIDKPLSGSTHPLAPLEVLAHASDLGGIAEFELSIGGQVLSTGPAKDPGTSLGNALLKWEPSEPGEYLLQVRARNGGGAWGPYADTLVIIAAEAAEETEEPPLAAGTIGGAVFADQNANGILDPNEGPLEGAQVLLKGCGPELTLSTRADGTFEFYNVPAGSCTLEVSKEGWAFSGSSPSQGYPLPVTSNPSLPATVSLLMSLINQSASEPQFGLPQLSANPVFYGPARCEPKRLTIQVTAQHPEGIQAMFFFHRLDEVDGGSDTGWSEGMSMNPSGNDAYSLSTSGDRLVGETGFNTQAVVTYQFVLQAKNGEYFRSPIYGDLYLAPCGSLPPARRVTSTPGLIIPPIIIVTPTFIIPH